MTVMRGRQMYAHLLLSQLNDGGKKNANVESSKNQHLRTHTQTPSQILEMFYFRFNFNEYLHSPFFSHAARYILIGRVVDFLFCYMLLVKSAFPLICVCTSCNDYCVGNKMIFFVYSRQCLRDIF